MIENQTFKIEADDAKALVDSGAASIIDVREENEQQLSRVRSALSAPVSSLESSFAELDLKKTVIFYCQVGQRSLDAAKTLSETYTDHRLFSVIGGIDSLKNAGMKIDQKMSRYSRQMLLRELGSSGQEKLLKSKVLIVGLGGLGSPAAFYLAAAGVSLGLIDDDTVSLDNLQRQIIHTEDRIGQLKVESAKESLLSLNSEIEVEVFPERINDKNAEAVISKYDLVLDGTDNFQTRYLINDVARRNGVPMVSASILSFSGQVTTIVPDGPCYRCIYPESPPPELAPACSVAGIIGAVAGITAMLQVNEAIKVLAGFGDILSGKILVFDAIENNFQTLTVGSDPDCPVCSQAAAGFQLLDSCQI